VLHGRGQIRSGIRNPLVLGPGRKRRTEPRLALRGTIRPPDHGMRVPGHPFLAGPARSISAFGTPGRYEDAAVPPLPTPTHTDGVPAIDHDAPNRLLVPGVVRG